MRVNVCFNGLEISVNRALLDIMGSHLSQLDRSGHIEDTDFDRWIHGQVYCAEYTML